MRRWIALAAALLCATVPKAARAHHILGLPHYAYKDNYPQAPVLEYPAQTGPYDVLLTSYPGRPVPGEAASVVVYIKNRNTGAPYVTPVSLRVQEQATFGQGREIVPPTPRAAVTNQFKYAIVFPEAGEYIVELTMEVEGKPEAIPFLVVAGNPRAPAAVPIALIGGLATFFVIVRALKRKRARRGRQTGVRPEPQAV